MIPCKLIGNAKGCLSCVISIRPIGVLIMEDGSGMDEKVIAVPLLISLGTTNLSMTILTHDHTDLPEISLKQKEHLFAHYKNLEPDKVVKI
jgi:inorganic pyrophosphatase